MNQTCATCGTEFEASRSWNKYCSVKCRGHSPAKSAATKRYQDSRRQLINQIKLEKGCAHCGYNKHPAALEFNHIDPTTKLFNISQDPKRAWSAMEAEMAKCEVLCSNCHHILSYERGHNRHKHQCAS